MYFPNCFCDKCEENLDNFPNKVYVDKNGKYMCEKCIDNFLRNSYTNIMIKQTFEEKRKTMKLQPKEKLLKKILKNEEINRYIKNKD